MQTNNSGARVSPTKPRNGGLTTAGAWTGMGAGGLGSEPFSNYCMREFDIDIHKNHTAMSPVQDKCKGGLKDRPECMFSLPHEPNGKTVVLAIRAFEKFTIECGLDGVFDIIQSDGTELKFLQEPGMVDQACVDAWCSDLLDDGVYTKGGNGSREAVCPYDRTNLFWSGEAVLNSCSPTLRQDLEHQILMADRTGPKVFMAMLIIIFRPSQSKIQTLRDQLGALDIRKYAGENITLFCQDASELVREIKLNFMKGVSVNDLTTTALKGLHHCADELIRIKFRTISIENDIHNFGGSVTSKQADVLATLRQADDMYRVLVDLGSYSPAIPVTKPTGGAFQAKADDPKDKLVGDRNASGPRNKPKGVCWDCNSPDHMRGSPDCPGKPAAPAPGTAAAAGSGTDTKSKHGLDPATHAIVLAKCAEKLLTMPKKENIPDDAEYNVMHNGQIVAKFCRHCGRFVKGESKHYTKEHTGTRSHVPYVPPTATPAVVAGASPPAVVAAVASVPRTSYDLTNVPSVNNEAFLSRQEANYALSVVGPDWYSSNPGLNANLAIPSDQDLADAFSEDADTTIQFLLNEFGGQVHP
jgi:hypothetical protein